MFSLKRKIFHCFNCIYTQKRPSQDDTNVPIEVLYNTNRFRTETMYDYYIIMKSMFLVAKLFSHPFIGYANFTILLPWTKHKQHQNHSKSKAFQNQNFNSHKLYIHTITLYKWKCFSRSQTPPSILIKRKLIKKLSKTYSPHGSPNNQKETKSHGPPCDSTINHRKQYHMVHMTCT